jgi:hypothetical protein
MNVHRHYLKHGGARLGELPCAKTGICADCNNPERICCYTVVIESMGLNILGKEETKKVVIIGEEAGL